MASRQDLANAIRALAMDAVQKAKSGHPGAPMGMAEIGEVLWNHHLSHNPTNPDWANRDRFILSNGHGSMLIYSLLHLTGYDLPMKEIENFRQLHSKCAGHPEYGYAPGVETTTGPLGQGISNGVGFAMAEKLLANQFNRPGHDIVDHHTYVFLGDGCLMEGVSHETCALAGTWGLGKLIAFWDDNGISIDGHIEGWYTDDTAARFESYGWHAIRDVDGHDFDAVDKAIQEAKKVTDKPTLICCKTIIGKGSPNKAASHDCHGAPLGEDEVALVRKEIGWEHAPFVIPQDVYDGWNQKDKGQAREDEWNAKFAAYEKEHPDLAAEFKRRMAGELPKDWKKHTDAMIKAANEAGEKMATRKASQNAIAALASVLPEFVGGSADLTGSNNTKVGDHSIFDRDNYSGTYIHYGVREHGMAAAMNGIALHGGAIPYGGTFMVFTDYCRPSIRLSALMGQRAIYVMTHDSIGLGEDGPTHQPVEHLAALRVIPNLLVFRPGDAVETAEAWQCAIEAANTPSILALSRQGMAQFRQGDMTENKTAFGGYIVAGDDADRQVTVIASGSEVGIALAARDSLFKDGIATTVVSMPCMELFRSQDAAYQNGILGSAPRIVIEAAMQQSWDWMLGPTDGFIGMNGFGASAPINNLYAHFGITEDAVVAAVRQRLG